MNDEGEFSYVDYIRNKYIDIFEINEINRNSDAKSEIGHLEYENPLLNELNDFLEKNAITIDDFLNDKLVVVLQEKKTPPRTSIILSEALNINKMETNQNISENYFSNVSLSKQGNDFSKKRNSMFDTILKTKPKEKQSNQTLTKKFESSIKNQNGEEFSIIKSEEYSSVDGKEIKNPEEENIMKEFNFHESPKNIQLETEVYTEKEDEKLFEKLLIDRNKLKLVDVKQSTQDKSHEVSPKIICPEESSSIQSNKSNFIESPLNYSLENNHEDTKLKVLTTNNEMNVKEEVKTLLQFQRAVTLQRSNTKMSRQTTMIEKPEEELKEKENLEEKMTRKMTQKLILIIMTLLIFLPVLDASYINIFLYENEDMSTVHKFCLNGIDDAFTKSIENVKYIKTIHKIFSHCIDLAEDGTSIKELQLSINSTDEQNSNSHRILGGGGGGEPPPNLIYHVLSPFPPYFYYFNFTRYENYNILRKTIEGLENKSYYLNYLPNETWQHDDYEYIKHYQYKGFSYFRSYFSNDDFTNSTIEFVYNNNADQMLQSILNILKVVVIGIVLIGGSMLFTDLINYYVVRPLDKVITRLEFYLNNTDSLNEEIEKDSIDKMDITSAYKKALLLINDREREKKFLSTNNETYELDSTIKVLINLVSVSLGKPGIRFNAVILMIKMTNTDNLVDIYGEVAHNILNKVYSVFHSQGLAYLGDVATGKNLVIWKEDRDKVNAQFKKYISLLSKLLFYLDDLPSVSTDSKNEVEEEFNYCQENIVSLGFLCANKVLQTLYMKIPRTMRLIKEHNIKLNLFLNYGEIFYGYIGHELKMDECFISNTIIESEKILLSLNDLYPEPSCFFHKNFATLLPNNLFNLSFPCEIVRIPFRRSYTLVKIFKLYFNPLKMYIDLEDSNFNLTKTDIVRDRKRNLKVFTNFDRRLEEFILVEDGVEFHTLKNIPSNFINRLNELFEDFHNKRLAECVVHIRKLKKGKDYSLFNDFIFKSRLDTLSTIITKKLYSKSKSNSKEKYYNYSIKF